MTEYSKKAQKLIELLNEDEIQQIQQDNPFRIERNDKIRELIHRGVMQTVLAEVSGMSCTSIGKIAAKIQASERLVGAGNDFCTSGN